MPDPVVGSFPFDEAIKYFRDKLRVPTAGWTDLWQGQHARAFTVAGAIREDLLRDMQAAILKAIAGGGTLAEFRKDFDRIVATYGWQYKGGRNWRTRVIFNTNLRMAHAAGKWDQAQRLKKARPYLRYVAIDDSRTRELHRHWHNTVLPIDDPWWQTHYPPNGWNCRCTTQSLSERDLKRFGIKPSEEAPKIDLVDKDVNFPDGARTIKVPDGIDSGFGYNPGEAAYGKKLADDVMEKWRASGADAWEQLTPGDRKVYGLPRELPEDALPARSVSADAGKSTENLAAEIQYVIGGKEKVFDLPSGATITVNAAALADHLPLDRAWLAPYLPEMLTDPAEIWMTFERHKGTGRVELRTRLVKVVSLAGEKSRGYLVTAQVVAGRLEAWTVVPTRNIGYLEQQRRGRLMYRRPADQPDEGEGGI